MSVATTLTQDIVRKHLHNTMTTQKCSNIHNVVETFLQYGKIPVDHIRTCFRNKIDGVKIDAHTISLADFMFHFR